MFRISKTLIQKRNPKSQSFFLTGDFIFWCSFQERIQSLAGHLRDLLTIFEKIVNDWKTLTIFAKSYILDLQLGSKHASGLCDLRRSQILTM